MLHSKIVNSDILIQDITLQPVSINTTLNSTVIFTCEAIADVLIFKVNNISSAHHTNVLSKGFTATINGAGTLRGELQAIAYDFNNNTIITCRAITDDPLTSVFSDESLLMIQGLYNVHLCVCDCVINLFFDQPKCFRCIR